MPNPIAVSVTVNKNTTPWTLVVVGNRNGGGPEIDVPQSAFQQPIQWNLELAAGDTGAFNALSLSSPTTSGFSWTVSPIPREFTNFSEPSLQNGKQIQCDDMNPVGSESASWTYKLRATVNGQSCETNPSPNPTANPGDPHIKNQ